MAEEGLCIGRLVRSTRGRDAGMCFLVVGVKDSRHVMLSDGRLRPLARPKKKNVRHLEILSAKVQEAEVRFAAAGVLTDRLIARVIDELLAELGESRAPTAAGTLEGEAGTAGGGELPEEGVKVYV